MKHGVGVAHPDVLHRDRALQHSRCGRRLVVLARRQLTFFLPHPVAAHVESVRRIMDPVQGRLIAAHVTVCREDEIAGLDVAALEAGIRHAPMRSLMLRFGPPERFDGHGMLLGCTAGQHEFRLLRQALLGPAARMMRPHITLAHPRNPRASGNVLTNASVLEHGLTVTFRTASLIEQQEGQPWRVIDSWELGAPTRAEA